MPWDVETLRREAGRRYFAIKRSGKTVAFKDIVDEVLNDNCVPVSDRAALRPEILSRAGRSGGKKSAQVKMRKKALDRAVENLNRVWATSLFPP